MGQQPNTAWIAEDNNAALEAVFQSLPLPAVRLNTAGLPEVNSAYAAAFMQGSAARLSLLQETSLGDLPNLSGQRQICRITPWVVPGDVRPHWLIENIHSLVADPLTGLLGRQGLLLEKGQDTGRYSALLIDINRFKEVNDTYGHAAGDRVLGIMGQLLQALAAHSGGWAYRLGGDEFLLLGRQPLSPWAIQSLQTEFADATQQVIGRACTFAYGQASQHGQSCCEMLETADQQMYRHKRAGRANLTLAGWRWFKLPAVRSLMPI